MYVHDRYTLFSYIECRFLHSNIWVALTNSYSSCVLTNRLLLNPYSPATFSPLPRSVKKQNFCGRHMFCICCELYLARLVFIINWPNNIIRQIKMYLPEIYKRISTPYGRNALRTNSKILWTIDQAILPYITLRLSTPLTPSPHSGSVPSTSELDLHSGSSTPRISTSHWK